MVYHIKNPMFKTCHLTFLGLYEIFYFGVYNRYPSLSWETHGLMFLLVLFYLRGPKHTSNEEFQWTVVSNSSFVLNLIWCDHLISRSKLGLYSLSGGKDVLPQNLMKPRSGGIVCVLKPSHRSKIWQMPRTTLLLRRLSEFRAMEDLLVRRLN